MLDGLDLPNLISDYAHSYGTDHKTLKEEH